MSNHCYYVAFRLHCGCIVGLVPYTDDQRKHVAKTVANWIRCGYGVSFGEYPQGMAPRPVQCKHEEIQLEMLLGED